MLQNVHESFRPTEAIVSKSNPCLFTCIEKVPHLNNFISTKNGTSLHIIQNTVAMENRYKTSFQQLNNWLNCWFCYQSPTCLPRPTRLEKKGINDDWLLNYPLPIEAFWDNIRNKYFKCRFNLHVQINDFHTITFIFSSLMDLLKTHKITSSQLTG